MIKIEVIGNLGADAQLQVVNGNKFVSFRVANTDSWTDKVTGEIKKSTQWISCSLNGDGGNLLPYLKKGAKVFVRGNANMVTYSSPKSHMIEVGVNLYVREIELCGGAREENQQQPTPQQQAPQQPAPPQQTPQQPAQTKANTTTRHAKTTKDVDKMAF